MARARSLSEFQTSFPDETSCAVFLFERRWPQGFVCRACGGTRAALLVTFLVLSPAARRTLPTESVKCLSCCGTREIFNVANFT